MYLCVRKSCPGELIEARGKVEASRDSEQKILQESEKLRADLQQSEDLVKKLESDLENTSFGGNRHNSSSRAHRGHGGSSSGSSGSISSMSAPDASLVALLSSEDDSARRGPSGSNGTIKPVSGGAGEGQMLAILTSQRDRYKERLDSMEGDNETC